LLCAPSQGRKIRTGTDYAVCTNLVRFAFAAGAAAAT
jgi:hypothetical protein